MPDASLREDVAAINRIFDLRKRAAEHRALAKSNQTHGGTSWAYWLFSACMFDSEADIIHEAMKRGKTVPKVDFGNEPFKG